MTDAEYRKVISRNLKRIAYDNHKTQADIVRDLGLKQPTVSSWMNGTRMIQMPEVDLLCHYFNCKRSDIMEEKLPGEMGIHAAIEAKLLEDITKTANELNEEAKTRLLDYAKKLHEIQKAEVEINDQIPLLH